jgi:hypothetical protein
MTEAYGRFAGSPSAWPRDGYMRSPVICTWIALALLLAAFTALGFRLNGDLDDLLKLHEIRHVLATGDFFDKTLPGILQPEPFVTHWPVFADLPYVAFAALIMPLTGAEAALAIACYAVPLLLLGPALYFFFRIVAATGFAHPKIVLPLAAIFAFRSFSEFAPGRVDYHNLEVLLLLASLSLTLSPNRLAPYTNGFVTALALAISLEFALFFALAMAIHAADFVLPTRDGESRMSAFGLALASTAVVLFAATVPVTAYSVAACDTYSAPHLMAVVCAGASFVAAPALSRQHGSPAARTAVLVVLAAASVAALVYLFPQCLGGPYAGLSEYVRSNWLDRIGQEKSLFERTDFLLSSSILSMTVLFVGALAPAMVAIGGRGRNRALVIFALFSLLALAHAIFYFRYSRYLPMFSGLGLAFVFAAFAPASSKFAGLMRNRASMLPQAKHFLIVPGIALMRAMGPAHLLVASDEPPLTAAEIADGCELSTVGAFDWPEGTRALSPPLIGIHLLSSQPGQAVVAIPFHAAAPGVERAYRFLDPSTADPRTMLDAVQATHVAVCAWRAEPLPELAARYPFAAALMEGRPPSWLAQCPAGEASPLRIYRYRNAGQPELACPARL